MDCEPYRGRPYWEVEELEPDCASYAWNEEQAGTPYDWPDEAVGVIDAVPVNDAPVARTTRTFRRAFAEYRTARDQCLSQPGETCGTTKDLRTQLENLEVEFPERRVELGPEFARVGAAHQRHLQVEIAEIERQFREEHLDITVNYGKLSREGKLRSDNNPLWCGDGSRFERYAELLEATHVAPNRIRAIYRAIAWENEWTTICEDGAPQPNYRRAYEAYVKIGEAENAKRVARLEWEEEVRSVCWESYACDNECDSWSRGYGSGSHHHPAGCEVEQLNDPDVVTWLTRAEFPEDDRRRILLAEADVAEDLGLPCDALLLAELAGDTERVRILTVEHGSECMTAQQEVQR